MIVKFIIFLLLLLGAVWAGWEIHQYPGYVLIMFRNSQIEMSLWVGILILLVLFFVLYFLLRFIIQSSHWSSRWREHNRTKALQQAHRNFEIGCCDLIEEKWHSAEEYFRNGADVIPKPFIYYAAAGIAANGEGATLRRNNYLKKAWQIAPEAEISLAILEAKLQIKAQEWDQAAQTLAKLNLVAPNHLVVKRLTQEISLAKSG